MYDMLIKIFLALMLGGVLGMERQYHDKPAGYAKDTNITAEELRELERREEEEEQP